MKCILSISFGKDSLASLLLILSHDLPLDEVVFYDTGAEFQAIYNIRDKVKVLLQQHNIKYVELKPKKPFFDTMYNYPHKARNGEIKQGYGVVWGKMPLGYNRKNQGN